MLISIRFVIINVLSLLVAVHVHVEFGVQSLFGRHRSFCNTINQLKVEGRNVIIIIDTKMKFAGLALAAVASTAAAIHSSRAPLFGVTRSTNYNGSDLATRSHGSVSTPSFLSVARGGASSESDDSAEEGAEGHKETSNDKNSIKDE